MPKMERYEYGIFNDITSEEYITLPPEGRWYVEVIQEFLYESDATDKCKELNKYRKLLRRTEKERMTIDRLLRRPVDLIVRRRRVIVSEWEDYTNATT